MAPGPVSEPATPGGRRTVADEADETDLLAGKRGCAAIVSAVMVGPAAGASRSGDGEPLGRQETMTSASATGQRQRTGALLPPRTRRGITGRIPSQEKKSGRSPLFERCPLESRSLPRGSCVG